ncbi:peptidoglycan recognition protein family protein [Salibacterium aidingense]|uniref:peptidoglycan recognition protein family protein n=1 Tax=Salibacterium aidingense TaxID=384933 RepID=UPI003BD4F1FA
MPKVKDIRHETPKRSETRSMSTVTKIIRHHSATKTGDFWSFWDHTWSRFSPKWQTGGYHEIILRDGTVQVCYRPTMVTNGTAGHNSYTYHICLVGNGSFTDEQEKTWHHRVTRAMAQFHLSAADVLGHRELPGMDTVCPGIEMNEVRSALMADRPLSGSDLSLLQFGDGGPEVEQLQKDLIQAGENLSIYGADGAFGEETKSAVLSFQRKHGLCIDGIADSETMAKLEDILSIGTGFLEDHQPTPFHEKTWKWAAEKNLMNGKYPKEYITREQLATVLHRYHQLEKGEK